MPQGKLSIDLYNEKLAKTIELVARLSGFKGLDTSDEEIIDEEKPEKRKKPGRPKGSLTKNFKIPKKGKTEEKEISTPMEKEENTCQKPITSYRSGLFSCIFFLLVPQLSLEKHFLV